MSKEYNYQIGAGYAYQWWLGVAIGLLIKENVNKIEKKDQSIIRINKIIESIVSKNNRNNILLEGYGKCFEDINILSDDNKKLTKIFIQVKGGKNFLDGGDETKGLLKDYNDIIYNFIENINFLDDHENTYFIIISRIERNNSWKKIFKKYGGEITKEGKKLISNFIISSIMNIKENSDSKIYKLFNEFKFNPIYIKKVDSFIVKYLNNINHNTPMFGDGLPFNSENDFNKFKKFLDLYILVLNQTCLIDNISDNDIEEWCNKILTNDKSIKYFYKVLNKSIDITEIKSEEPDFDIYKSYIDKKIFFTDKSIQVRDLNSIDKGKFLL